MTTRSKFEAQMDTALRAYSNELPVVIKDERGSVLHGKEILKQVVELGVSLDCIVIDGVDRDLFESTTWPEKLEAARLVFWERQREQDA